jgi:predicted esterase
MLSLHNWGGTYSWGTADPLVLADKYNVVAICVDYVQTGEWKETGKPYDYGLYQTIDALRGLYYVFSSLSKENILFHRGRIYVCGGSGGGNVALMAAKFAPRTFACVVDMSGMVKLNDQIAFGLEGESYLNAGYSREPGHPFHLSPGEQEIRFVAKPEHLETMKRLGATTQYVVSHGSNDTVCPVAEVREMVANLKRAGFSVDAHYIVNDDLDGETFTDTEHWVGNRTLILQTFADPYLLPESETMLYRDAPNDFELMDDAVRYEVTGGHYIIDYRQDGPVLSWRPS